MKNTATETPKEKWNNEFLTILQGLNFDYKLNKNVKGRFTECLREYGSCFYSQNTVFANAQYSHCFAISLTDQISGYLNSPFWIGARFDGNHTIFNAFEKDLNAVVRGPDRVNGIHSTHSRRTGTETIVCSCARNAEIYLAPYYISEFKKSFPLLLQILKFLNDNKEIIYDKDFCLMYADQRLQGVDLSWRQLASPPSDWLVFGSNVHKVLVASCREKFLPHQNQLDKIYERVQKAAST